MCSVQVNLGHPPAEEEPPTFPLMLKMLRVTSPAFVVCSLQRMQHQNNARTSGVKLITATLLPFP
jgi:hypothetical protein